MFRLPCKDYLKELAPIHSVKNGILQNACSTRPRVGADLVKSARMHIARLMNSLAKGPKRMVTKVAMLNKHESYDRTSKPVVCRDTCHERDGPVVCNSSNTRQLGCVFQDMEPPKSSSILRKSSNIRKPIRFVKFTKAVVTLTFETKILRSDVFAQVILISVTPMLQNLRIGLRKRQNGKSDVPVKQRGGWLKASWK